MASLPAEARVAMAMRRAAAPEAAQGPLTAYADIIPLLDYLTPQFYNTPPNAVATPFLRRLMLPNRPRRQSANDSSFLDLLHTFLASQQLAVASSSTHRG